MPWGKIQEVKQYDDFTIVNYLDESVWMCKCGSSFENGSYTDLNDLRAWEKEHKPHCQKEKPSGE